MHEMGSHFVGNDGRHIKIHGPDDFESMRRAGRLAAECLDYITPSVKPGVTTEHLDKLCHDFIVENGALPAPLDYRGFPKSICTSVNHVVCHGIPGNKKLAKGDILNIDVTVKLDGWHGDSSRMFPVGKVGVKATKLMDATFEAMWEGIKVVRPGATLGDIGHAIQSHAEGKRYAVVRDFCLSSGGPYFGIMACKQKLVRQMPGRIVGRTTDLDGKSGFTLTLQAREQHIRRSKATSNICTNQGLMVTAATIYMSLLGPQGLSRVALASHRQTTALLSLITQIDGVEALFQGPCFHEAGVKLDRPVGPVLDTLAARNILGGYNLSRDFPELGNALLVCATETKTQTDLETFADALQDIMNAGNVRSA